MILSSGTMCLRPFVTIIPSESISGVAVERVSDSVGEEKTKIITANIAIPIPVAEAMYFSKSLKNYLKNIKEFFQI